METSKLLYFRSHLSEGNIQTFVLVRFCWYLDEVACNVPPSDVEASGQVWQREALVHGTDVSDAITRIHNDSSQQA